MKIPEALITTIVQSEKVALFTHIHPDGDALGSMLAFADILRVQGKDVFCYLEEPAPELYHFLPNVTKTSTSLDDLQAFCEDRHGLVGISLDCGDCDRLGKNQKTILDITPFLAIDHHRTHRDFGAARWVAPDCSSTGEMVYELAKILRTPLSKEAALNLYVAIATDTGSFKYEATTSRTMHIAADLLDYGVSPAEVYGYLYNSSSSARIALMQKVLSSLALFYQEKIAVISLRREMLEECGASSEDTEGFIDIPRSISSVVVVAFIKEGDEQISVSLRAKGQCDVSAIANAFGGGGHRNASGFRFTGKSMQEVEPLVVAEIAKHLPDLTS